MKKMLAILAILLARDSGSAFAEPLFPNSVASNDLEFITTSDAHVFNCLEFMGRFTREMPQGPGGLFQDDTFVFTSRFTDGTNVGLWVHPDFESKDTAEALALQLGQPLGRLPTFMRAELDHVVILPGDGSAFEEAGGGFFGVFAENMAERIRNHDLEETVFHESVHVALDATHTNTVGWQTAQQLDADFITEYAARFPEREDLAESALFAWAMLRHPGRLPDSVELGVREVMPNRLAYLESVLNQGEIFEHVGPSIECQSVPEPSFTMVTQLTLMLLLRRKIHRLTRI